MTRKELLKNLKIQLATNDRQAVKGLMTIYASQTLEERRKECTIEDNGVGFSGKDSMILTSFAKQVDEWNKSEIKKFPAPLSDGQMNIVHRLMPRYANQLIEQSLAKGLIKRKRVGKSYDYYW